MTQNYYARANARGAQLHKTTTARQENGNDEYDDDDDGGGSGSSDVGDEKNKNSVKMAKDEAVRMAVTEG